MRARFIPAGILLALSSVAAQPAVAQDTNATIAALAQRVERLENELGKQRDVEEIRVLQYSYGYYMDNWLYKQVVDLFTREPVSVEWGGGGVYLGRAGLLRKYANGVDLGPQYGMIREHLQLQGVIHVADDRKTARARFRALAFSVLSPTDAKAQSIQSGLYEMEYAKEDGVWKISKLDYKQTMTTPYQDGPGKTQLYSACGGKDADAPTTWYHPYPEAGVFPYHYNNPVTGAPIPKMLAQQRYWVGNWPGEFGKCGKVSDAQTEQGKQQK
jgi:hypothetical protein